MRNTFLIIMFFIVTAYKAQAQKSNEQMQVRLAVIKIFDGIAALDTMIIKQYSTRNFLLLEDGAIWNMDSLASKLNQFRAVSFSRINNLDFIHTEVKGNSAWTVYNNAADITVNGNKINVLWLESAFLIKEGKAWKIQMLHSTRLKPKTP